jgi:serine/threonine-protein kinase
MDDLTGRTIGPYELRDWIGTGGMATVYRGVHRALGQPRAVKVLLPTHAADPILVERFRSEAKLAAGLRHPNIVPIYDVGEDDGLFYMVMDFVEGVPLGRLVEEEGALPVDRAISLLRQLASALDYAHGRGIIHRDVKAGNVLVGPDDRVTLFDFGIARGVEVGRLTKPGLMVGTPHYLAPEVISGAEGDRRADLYALGILAFEMLAGRLPYMGSDTLSVLYAQVNSTPPSLRGISPDVPFEVEQVVNRQMAKRPDDRYSTATAFVSALSDASHGLLLLPGEGTLERFGVAGAGGSTSAPTTTSTPPPATAPVHGAGLSSVGQASAGQPVAGLVQEPITPTTLFYRPPDDDTPTPQPIPRPDLATFVAPVDEPESPTGQVPVGLVAARRPGALTRPRRSLLVPVLVGGTVLATLAVIVAAALMIFARRPGTETTVQPTATTVAAAQAATSTSAPATATRAPAAAVVAPATATTPAQVAVAAPAVAPTQAPPPTPAPPVAAVAAVAAPSPPSPEEQLGTAQAAIERGDFSTALPLLAALQQASPSPDGLDEARYKGYLGYGQQLLDQGQLDESNAQFGEALAIRPDDPAALEGQKQVTLAKLWQTMEAAWDKDEAISSAALEEMLALDPGYRDASVKLYALLVARGEGMLAEGDRDGAIAAFQRAATVYPDGPEAEARLAALTAPPPQPLPEAPAAAPAPAPAQQAAPARQPAPASAPPPAAQPPIQPPPIQPPAGLPAPPNLPAGLPGFGR